MNVLLKLSLLPLETFKSLFLPALLRMEMDKEEAGTMQETGQNKRGERRGENFSYQDNGEKT